MWSHVPRALYVGGTGCGECCCCGPQDPWSGLQREVAGSTLGGSALFPFVPREAGEALLGVLRARV